MTSALGINTTLVYGGVFALGGLLAGLAGALAVPVRSLVAGHGLLDPDRVVHRHRHRRHGLGGRRAGRRAADRAGAQSSARIGFPLFTEGLMFLFMTVILIVKPSGLFGRQQR